MLVSQKSSIRHLIRLSSGVAVEHGNDRVRVQGQARPDAPSRRAPESGLPRARAHAEVRIRRLEDGRAGRRRRHRRDGDHGGTRASRILCEFGPAESSGAHRIAHDGADHPVDDIDLEPPDNDDHPARRDLGGNVEVVLLRRGPGLASLTGAPNMTAALTTEAK